MPYTTDSHPNHFVLRVEIFVNRYELKQHERRALRKANPAFNARRRIPAHGVPDKHGLVPMMALLARLKPACECCTRGRLYWEPAAASGAHVHRISLDDADKSAGVTGGRAVKNDEDEAQSKRQWEVGNAESEQKGSAEAAACFPMTPIARDIAALKKLDAQVRKAARMPSMEPPSHLFNGQLYDFQKESLWWAMMREGAAVAVNNVDADTLYAFGASVSSGNGFVYFHTVVRRKAKKSTAAAAAAAAAPTIEKAEIEKGVYLVNRWSGVLYFRKPIFTKYDVEVPRGGVLADEMVFKKRSQILFFCLISKMFFFLAF